MIVTINVDGSFYPKTKKGGFAFWIACDVGRYKKWGKLKECHQAVESEMMTLGNALYYIKSKEELWGISKVIINWDCKDAIDGIEDRNRWKGKTGKKRKRWIMLSNRLRQLLSAYPHYEFRHVKSHSKIDSKRKYVNDWLDKHAKLGANL